MAGMYPWSHVASTQQRKTVQLGSSSATYNPFRLDMTTQQFAARSGPAGAPHLQREQPLPMGGRRPSHQPNRGVEGQPQQLVGSSTRQDSADVNPFDLLLGDNLTHYMTNIEPLLRHNQAHMPMNHPAITYSSTPAQSLTATRPVPATGQRVPVHHGAQASVRNPRDNPHLRLPSPPTRAPQPPQERANKSPTEAAKAPAAVSPPNSNNKKNNKKKKPTGVRQPRAKATGKRAQNSARLHAAGKCIWCRQDNPDKSRMGCPECRRQRVKMTERWRQRVLARESGDAQAQGEAQGEAQGRDGEGKQGEGEQLEEHELEGREDNGEEDSK